MISLLAALHYANINPPGPDQFKWGVADNKEFSVKAAYKLLGPLSTITESWPWNFIWKIKLPPKISCFSWTALHQACLTQDNLARRKFQMADRCYMCLKETEIHSHLFLQRPVASDLWNMFISLFGLRWVMPTKHQRRI